jgi:hypothetical protein
MNLRMRSSIAIFSLIVGMFAVVLSGCTALNTFPQAARVGETVALPVGSADGMTRANTTASFESDTQPGVFYDLTPSIRSIFRLYADKSSSLYAVGSTTGSIVNTSGHEPWITIIAVDLPTETPTGPLPTGPGKVHISTSATYPMIGSHINDLPIGLEILPGTGGVASDFAYEFGVGASQAGDLALLEALPHAQIIPDFEQSGDWPTYGAIEMRLNVQTSAGTPVRVVADDLRVTTRSGLSIMSTRRDINQDMDVILMSPLGKLRYYEQRFSVVLVDREDVDDFFSVTPVITSVNYYDIDGNQVAGPLAADYSIELR